MTLRLLGIIGLRQGGKISKHFGQLNCNVINTKAPINSKAIVDIRLRPGAAPWCLFESLCIYPAEVTFAWQIMEKRESITKGNT